MKTDTKTIIAIDPSIREAGWAMRYDNEVTSGFIRSKGDSTPERIHSLLLQMPIPFETPVDVVIEVPEFTFRQKQINPKSMFVLNRAIGAVEGFCICWPDTKVFEVAVRHWKGKMDKATGIMIAQSLVDKRIKNHNEADAICLLDWYWRIGRYEIRSDD